MFSLDDGGEGGEGEAERLPRRGINDKKGGRGATVPWQQAVEAGKMAAGDTTPGQVWSTAPSSGLLSPHQSVDDAGSSTYRQRAAASPVSLMCRAGMSDAGLGPNTQTKPRGSLIHSHTPHLLTLISLIPPFSHNELTDMPTPTGKAASRDASGIGDA